jgi:hypothetical protein
MSIRRQSATPMAMDVSLLQTSGTRVLENGSVNVRKLSLRMARRPYSIPRDNSVGRRHPERDLSSRHSRRRRYDGVSFVPWMRRDAPVDALLRLVLTETAMAVVPRPSPGSNDLPTNCRPQPST